MSPLATGQDATAEQGFKPYGVFHGGNFDSVSLVNGTLNLSLPLWSMPQRGKLSLSFSLVYNNGSFVESQDCSIPKQPCSYFFDDTTRSGQRVQPVANTGLEVDENDWIDLGATRGKYWSLQTPDGAVHKFGDLGSGKGEAIDGSGWQIDYNSNFITDRSGVRFYLNGAVLSGSGIYFVNGVEDPNGNQITVNFSQPGTNWKDSLGRTIPALPVHDAPAGYPGITTNTAGCNGPLPIASAIAWAVPGPGGTTSTFTFCYASIHILTGFPNGTGVSATYFHEDDEYRQQLQNIVLPDGSAYTFQYGPTDQAQVNYGDLTQITLPTGGTISYQWTQPQYSCKPVAGYPHNFHSSLASRTVDAKDGTGPQTWTYTGSRNAQNGNGAPFLKTITDPQGNQSVHTITGLGNSCSYYETDSQYFQGTSSAGTLLKSEHTDYQFSADANDIEPDNTPIFSMDVMPIHHTITWANGAKAETDNGYDGGFSFTAFNGTSATAHYGNVTSKNDYDYAANAPGPLLRQTITKYWAFSHPAYLPLNLLDLPESVQVLEGSGTQASLTKYGYDETGLQPSGIGSAQQHNPSPINGATRGNQTSISRFWDTNNKDLVTNTTFLDTGLPSFVNDPLLHQTTFQYSGNYVGAYLTQTTNALGQNISHTYDSNTGLLVSTTDENNQTTSYTYDSLLRPNTITTPTQGNPPAQGVTTFNYPNQNTVERLEAMNGSQSVDSFLYLDGLGRESQSKLIDPEGSVYVDTTYDGFGRKHTVSNAYRSTSDASYGLTTYAYDALGRVTQITNPDATVSTTAYSGSSAHVTNPSNGTLQPQKLTQSDALGRLTSVCEVTATNLLGNGGTTTDCGTDFTGLFTGFRTTYQYNLRGMTEVDQNGLTPRTFAYDSLSQLTTATNPESGTLGYTYDDDGRLILTTKPMPGQPWGSAQTVNVTYGYDNLHRLTSKQYNDGVTLPVSYNYDEGSALGVSIANGVGRRTSEYTKSGATTITSSIYSYDSMGRVVQHNQCTPANCGGYTWAVGYGYDLAGNISSETNGMGTSFSFNYDSAERLMTASSSWSDGAHPSSLFSGASYSPFGSLTGASLGNGVTETLAYDKRERVTSQTDSHVIVVTPGVPATASVTIGSATGTGGVQSATVQVTAAAPGTATVTVNGIEQTYPVCVEPGKPCGHGYDSGSVTVTVNGHPDSGSFGMGSLTSTVASRLYTAIQQDTGSPVVPSNLNGSTFTITSRVAGAATNYSLAASWTYDTNDLKHPSFTAAFSPATAMQGGSDATYTTVYDSGSVSVTVNNGVPKTSNYGNGSTTLSIAQDLQNKINSDSSLPVTVTSASASGANAILNLQSKAANAGADYPLSVTQTYDTGHFSRGSFPPSAPATLSGGKDPVTGGSAEYAYNVVYNPDGTMQSSSDMANGNWSYSYDDFDRLKTANQTNSSNVVITGLSWDYDRFGNRWHQNATAGSPPQPQIAFDANNHPLMGQGLAYDAAGEITADGTHSYLYDGENRIACVDPATPGTCANGGAAVYTYDAEGRRVRKQSGAGTVDYILDLSGQTVSEVNSSGGLNRSDVYVGGRHLATYSGTTATYFIHGDWLGTERMRTDMNSSMYEACSNLPFGDQQQCTGSGDPSPNHFTGRPRDTESNLDDFGARYFSSQYGRWMSPDWSASPEPVPYAILTNPQSLNLYAYVSNDPIMGEDADGHAQFEQSNARAVDGSRIDGEIQAAIQFSPLAPVDKYWPSCFCARDGDSSTDQAQHSEAEPAGENASEQTKPGEIKLPSNPSGLGPEWKRDPSHKSPNDERYVNDKGEQLDWHKGIPGAPGEMGTDHWHRVPPDGKDKEHYHPGDVVSLSRQALAWAGEHKTAIITTGIVVGVAATILTGGAAAPAMAVVF